MNQARRLLLGLLIALGLVRAVSYIVYAVSLLPSPVETFHLEAKMVLLAYRAEVGESLYPAWRDYPHVANFFGPVYFGVVGLLGRAVGAEIPGLFGIGRALSFGSGVLTSLLVGVIAARRYGRVLGFAGGLLSLSTTSMIGFSVMVRPDLTAELLGVAGFVLAGGRNLSTRIVGGVVLILAILTKQTTVVFLMAAALAWVFAGKWRRGLTLGVGTALALVGVIGGVTLLVEPTFAESLVGESRAPTSLEFLSRPLFRVCTLSPDAVYFPLLGLVLWSTGATGRREVRSAVLATLILAVSVVTSTKRGSDVNYYLSLRVVEALAVGALWQAWSIAPNRRRSMGLAMAAVVGCLTLTPGVVATWQQARFGWVYHQFFEGPSGKQLVAVNRELGRLAADPKSRILTDAGLLDLDAGKRAVFGDPWLFRMLTETGRIDPVEIRERIDSQYYDLVITTSEVDPPAYDLYEFGLPKTLADRVRARYVLFDIRVGYFLYHRRPVAAARTRLEAEVGRGARPDPP